MKLSKKVLTVLHGAHRIDVFEDESILAKDQVDRDVVDRQLRKRMRPKDAQVKVLADDAARVAAEAIERLIQGEQARKESAKKAQLRRTRLQTKKASDRAALPISRAALMFSEDKWDPAAAQDIVRAGMGAIIASFQGQRPVGIAFSDIDVDHGTLAFELGAGSSSVLGIATCSAFDVETPFASRIMERVVAEVNRHTQSHPDVRFKWVLILGPGRVRVCLAELDAAHLSAVQKTTDKVGRFLLGSITAHAAFSEPWRLGSDQSMKWCDDIRRWRIDCYNSIAKKTRVFYAPRVPLFVSQSFFGRFTRCFRVSEMPDDENFAYVLKDSWQLVLAGLSDGQLRDEINVLREIQAKMERVNFEACRLQHLECGGTVQVNDKRDSTRFVLGTELDSYQRLEMTHGSDSSAHEHRVHRRMVSGPVGTPLHELRVQDAVTAVASAMLAHALVLEQTGVLHRDISEGNIMAVRDDDSNVKGVLIDFDNAVSQDEERNRSNPGHVGTPPFKSIANLEGLDVPRTAVDDWEAALALIVFRMADSKSGDKLADQLSKVDRNGTATLRRKMFASRKSFDDAVKTYAKGACAKEKSAREFGFIRDLYAAIFAHSDCSGTTRGKKGGELVDPILRRVRFAADIHEKCLAVVTRYLAPPPPASTESPVPQHPPHPPTSTTPLTSSGLGVKLSKRKPEAKASPLVKQRKVAHDSVGSSPHPAPAPATVPPQYLRTVSADNEILEKELALPRPVKRKASQEDVEASSQPKRHKLARDDVDIAPAISEVGSPTCSPETHSYVSPSSRASSDSARTLDRVITDAERVSRPGKRKPSQEDPPVVSSHKRRKT
ncbi:hypothetical protein GGF41_000224 [Coemansia sp. RSA 2531]|nr:hypothetical protein GGF41_000224 [Coemansia sp. RSA 2531]